MRSSLRAAIALLLCVCSSATAVEPALQPRHAVIVLKNRQVLEGEVTPAGDYYLVSLGKTGQVRLAAKDVEMICADLAEAYDRKASAIEGKSAAAHLELADWCLRQSLHARAGEQLSLARSLDPKNRKLTELEQRLSFATAKPAKTAARPVSTTATVGAQQLERTMQELPPGAVEHFTSVVQPILMDRCGAVKCHGVGSTASFQLLQPLPGKVPSRRFTQRNLFATLSAVNKARPDDSRILEMALKPHGHVPSAGFKSSGDRQYKELVEWVQSLRAVPRQLPPETVSTDQIGTLRPQIGSPASLPAEKDEVADEPTAPSPARDPFDPEVFNRRYHK